MIVPITEAVKVSGSKLFPEPCRSDAGELLRTSYERRPSEREEAAHQAVIMI